MVGFLAAGASVPAAFLFRESCDAATQPVRVDYPCRQVAHLDELLKHVAACDLEKVWEVPADYRAPAHLERACVSKIEIRDVHDDEAVARPRVSCNVRSLPLTFEGASLPSSVEGKL